MSFLFSDKNYAGLLLAASLLALFLGPCIHHVIKRREWFLEFIDGFCVVTITGMVLFSILPHTVADSGLIALVVASLGVLAPTYLEHKLHGALARKTHVVTLFLALIGVSLHEFADGLALANASSLVGDLPVAIVLHRLPIGLVIWWLIRPAYGLKKSLMVVAAIALMTLFGFYLGTTQGLFVSHANFGLFEALVAGSLLHVILHRHNAFYAPHREVKTQYMAGLGAILGIVALLMMRHEISFENSATTTYFDSDTTKLFLRLAQESAPSLLVAYLFSGLVQSFMTAKPMAWLKSGGEFKGALKGMLFGLPLPICSCGVVPVYRSLIKQGAPLAAAISFFVATPELGFDAFLLSFPLLGAKLTIARLLMAALVALAIGWILGKVFDKHKSPITEESLTHETLSFKEKIKKGIAVGFGDAVDHTGPWIVIGLLVAAFAEPILNETEFFRAMPELLMVPFFALLGMPLYVCASGATPIVAVLIHSGVSPGAGLAFLLTGPATNVATFGVLKELHGKKLAASFALGMALLSIGAGYGVDFILGEAVLPNILAAREAAPMHQVIGLILLALVYLFSLTRRGPRFWINQIIAFESESDGHDHGEHAPHHEHDHDKESCCP